MPRVLASIVLGDSDDDIQVVSSTPPRRPPAPSSSSSSGFPTAALHRVTAPGRIRKRTIRPPLTTNTRPDVIDLTKDPISPDDDVQIVAIRSGNSPAPAAATPPTAPPSHQPSPIFVQQRHAHSLTPASPNPNMIPSQQLSPVAPRSLSPPSSHPPAPSSMSPLRITSSLTRAHRAMQMHAKSPRRPSSKMPAQLVPPQPPPPPPQPRRECPVCLGEFERPVVTLCGHIFCKECLQASLKAANKCPNCRKPIKKKGGYHEIYL